MVCLCLRRLGTVVKSDESRGNNILPDRGLGAAYQSKICVGRRKHRHIGDQNGGRQDDGSQADSLGQAATDEECTSKVEKMLNNRELIKKARDMRSRMKEE